MKFNEKLINLRKKAGLSQEELGYKLNVTRQTISKWELGQTTPEMDKLKEISNIFNISVDDLLNESAQDSSTKKSGGFNKKYIKYIIIGIIILIIIAIPIIIKINNAKNKLNNSRNELEENVSEIIDESKSMSEGIFGLTQNFIGQVNDGFDKSNVSDVFNEIDGFNKNTSATSFNNELKLYSGTALGLNAKSALEKIIEINQTGNNKIIVKYNDEETSDISELRNIKNKIDITKLYDVSYDYDSEGNITTAIITEL